MTYKINEYLDAVLIRDMCIKHKYFTAGTNDTYYETLNKFDMEDSTNENILELAKIIYDNSTGMYDSGFIADIMTNILREGVARYVNCIE